MFLKLIDLLNFLEFRMSCSHILVKHTGQTDGLNSAISVTMLGEAAHHSQQWHAFDFNPALELCAHPF